MVERIQAIRGMNDILPEQTFAWRHVEQAFVACMTRYGYQEIRTPILESTQLFKRTIGDITDIVEKEMYTFQDRNGESLTLRPENTAGCVRACLEHGLLHNQQQKLWYSGSMFRHEKPQKGRYRQFHQLGVEAFGIAGVAIELELIAMCRQLWRTFGIEHVVALQINTLGTLEERQAYANRLTDYFKTHVDALDEDSKRRLDKNPMRILDSKNPSMQSLIAKAPKLLDDLSATSRQHFADVCHGLDALGITYTINPLLVRGLDYYGHTVFEWVTDRLGSQATVCAGGRFDALIEQLGGNKTPAVGFAMGVERLLMLMASLEKTLLQEPKPLLFMMADSQETLVQGLVLAEKLREQEPQWHIYVHTAGGSFKSQFKKADKSGARFALILGQQEMQQGTIGIKDLRYAGEQVTVSQSRLRDDLQSYL